MTDQFGESVRRALARITARAPELGEQPTDLVAPSGSSHTRVFATLGVVLLVAAGAGVVGVTRATRSSGPDASVQPTPIPTAVTTAVPPSPPDNTPTEPPVVWRHEVRSPLSEQARVQGTLSYDAENGCFMLGGYPVVWPSGTEPSVDPFGVRLVNGTIIPVSSEVLGAGGYGRVAEEYGIPPECVPSTGEVAVFNPGDEPVVM